MTNDRIKKALDCINSNKLHNWGLNIECKFCPYGQVIRLNDTDILENRICDKEQIIADAKKAGLISTDTEKA